MINPLRGHWREKIRRIDPKSCEGPDGEYLLDFARMKPKSRFSLGCALLVLVVASGCPPAISETDIVRIIGDRPVFRRVDSGSPNILRSEVDFSLANDEVALRKHIAGRQSVTVNDIRKTMADMTYLTYDGFHGSQVEYASKDGGVYLWYPGNRIILRGEWQPKQVFVEYFSDGALLKRFEYSHICFRYGANTHNPATGHVGDGWECQVFDAYRKHLGESKRGDILKLRKRTEPPFVLSNEKISLDALRTRVRG